MSYTNPAMPTGQNPYMVGVKSSANLINKGLKDIAARQEARRQEIQEMQEREYKIDQWKIGQINQLNQIEQIPNVDMSVTNMLAAQIDYAAQANLYLATQFGDDEKRAEARDVVSNYQKLLNTTSEFAGSWDANVKLWSDKYLSLNQPGGIRLVGDPGTEEGRKELRENQWLLDVLSSRYNKGASIEVVYDPAAKDMRMNVKGSDIDGNTYDKSILGQEWMKLMNSADGYEFIVDVPKGPSVMIEKMQTMTNNEGEPIMDPNKALDSSLFQGKPKDGKQLINTPALRGLLVGEANQMVNGIMFGAKGNQMPESFYDYTLKQASDTRSWASTFYPEMEEKANQWNTNNAQAIKDGAATAKTSADTAVEDLTQILIDRTIASIPNLEVLGEYNKDGVFTPELDAGGNKQYYYKVSQPKPIDDDKRDKYEKTEDGIIAAVNAAYDNANNADANTDAMSIVQPLQQVSGYTFAPAESGDALLFDVFKPTAVTKDGKRTMQDVLVDQFQIGDPDTYQELITFLNKGKTSDRPGFDTIPKSSQYVNDMIKALEGSSLDKILESIKETGLTPEDETKMMGALDNITIPYKEADNTRGKISFKKLLEDAGITYDEAVMGSDVIGFTKNGKKTKIKIDGDFLDNLIKYLRDNLPEGSGMTIEDYFNLLNKPTTSGFQAQQ